MNNEKIKPEILVQGGYLEEQYTVTPKSSNNKLEVKRNPNKYIDENAFTEIYNALMQSNED